MLDAADATEHVPPSYKADAGWMRGLIEDSLDVEDNEMTVSLEMPREHERRRNITNLVGLLQRRSRVGICIPLMAMLLLACAGDKNVVATYRGGKVTKDDLERRVMSLTEKQRAPGRGESRRDWEEKLAGEIVLERVLVSPERMTLQRGTMLRPGPWARFLVQQFKTLEGQEMVDVPDDSVAAFYERNWSRFFIPEGVKFQHVFLPFEPGDGTQEKAAARALADSVRAYAFSGTDFDELVERYSGSESRGWQGRVSMMFRGQLPACIEAVVFSLEAGEISAPVATEHGYHVIKVLERQAEELRSLEDVGPIIRRQLATEELVSRRSIYMERLNEEIPIHLNAEAFFATEPGSTVVLNVADERITKAEIAKWLEEQHLEPKDREEMEELLLAMGAEAQLYEQASRRFSDDQAILERYSARVGQVYVDSVLAQKLRMVELDEQLLEDHYEAHALRFSSPRTWSTREILIAGPEGERYDAWKRANEVVELARRGEGFADLAKKYSSSPSAADGGWLGKLTLQDTANRGPDLQKTLRALKQGEVSDPLRVDGGYLILKLETIDEPVERAFDEVKEQVREAYISKNKGQLIKELRDMLLKQTGFRYKGAEE